MKPCRAINESAVKIVSRQAIFHKIACAFSIASAIFSDGRFRDHTADKLHRGFQQDASGGAFIAGSVRLADGVFEK